MSMPGDRAELGLLGERLAEKHLRSRGMKTLARRFNVSAGELDLVMQDGDTVVFVEVKTQRSAAVLDPYERVNSPKRRRMVAAAKWFIAKKKLHERPCRFDVVSIVMPETGEPSIQHIATAFVPARW